MSTSHQLFIDHLQKLVDTENVITQTADLKPYTTEWRNAWHSECIAAVLPGTVEEVSRCVKLCAQYQISIVTQGGNTGLCGGAVSRKNQLILSTVRLNKIRDLDPDNNSITVESGCILEDIQVQAAQENRLFPLSLGSQGRCQIGGNLSTNAGGINVLRYGNARDLCLGIEVVLANGEVMSNLTALRKDNTGYDLKNLFIGAEGTLGIITAATLKLFPTPKSSCTALVAFADLAQVNTFFTQLRESSGEQISIFELIPGIAIELTEKHFPSYQHPFEKHHPWYVLAVLQSQSGQDIILEQIQNALSQSLDASVIIDAVVAHNSAQTANLMQLRELLVEAQSREGASLKHDVSISISAVSAFVQAANELVETTIPGARPYPFGHFGDGNIHYNVSQPPNMEAKQFLDQKENLSPKIYDLVNQLSGSFSAEHGIGLLKVNDMALYKDAACVNTMLSIKQALDPDNLLNPDKVLPLA